MTENKPNGAAASLQPAPGQDQLPTQSSLNPSLSPSPEPTAPRVLNSLKAGPSRSSSGAFPRNLSQSQLMNPQPVLKVTNPGLSGAFQSQVLPGPSPGTASFYSTDASMLAADNFQPAAASPAASPVPKPAVSPYNQQLPFNSNPNSQQPPFNPSQQPYQAGHQGPLYPVQQQPYHQQAAYQPKAPYPGHPNPSLSPPHNASGQYTAPQPGPYNVCPWKCCMFSICIIRSYVEHTICDCRNWF